MLSNSNTNTNVTRKITRAVARIALGLQDTLYLGNLDAQRDWGHAKDYVEGMWLMLQHNKPDDYVLATGETHSVSEFVELAFAEVGITDWKKYVTIDARFKRPAEVPLLLARATKANTKLGWKPKMSFSELVKTMVAADLKRLQK